jgi:hypothetical protein
MSKMSFRSLQLSFKFLSEDEKGESGAERWELNVR